MNLTVECSKCGARHTLEVPQSVNAAADPELKERVRSGALFTWSCPQCGTLNLLNFPFLYHDPSEHLMIVLSETPLGAEGVPMLEMRQTVANLSEPMKSFQALVLEGRMHHNGDPVLAWMVSNVVCHVDAKENIYPRKEFPENKIDGVVAGLMALNRALATTDQSADLNAFLEL